MTTVTIKLNEQHKEAKALLEYLKKLPFVEIQKKEKDYYNPEFVRKIREAEKRANYIEVNPEDIWGSLGLK